MNALAPQAGSRETGKLFRPLPTAAAGAHLTMMIAETPRNE